MQDWNTTLTLGLWNCRGLRADEDIVGMLGILRELGLEPASGMYGDGRPSEPAGDLAAFVAARLRDSRQGTLSEGKDLPYFRLEPRRGMSFALLHPSMPGLRGGGSVQLSHPVIWDVVIHAYVGSYDSGSDPREADSAFMGELLERIGDSLYELARPAIAYLVAEAFDEDTGVDPQHPDRRRLIVGWRTWFGPAYVDHWGREWLLQLPDGATELDDGGVKHSLEASAFEVVRGDAAAYARVWPYLHRWGVRHAYPPGPWPSWPARTPDEEERELASLRTKVDEFLRPTVFAHGCRVIGATMPMALLAEAERVVVWDAIYEAVERELRDHPWAHVVLELDVFDYEDIGPSLMEALAALKEANPRFWYTRVSDDARAWELRERFAALTGRSGRPREQTAG